jgi:hypothetical protein
VNEVFEGKYATSVQPSSSEGEVSAYEVLNFTDGDYEYAPCKPAPIGGCVMKHP